MIRLVLFASGNGSNAQRISEYFLGHPRIEVSLVLSNKPDAFVLERARNLGIPAVIFNRAEFYDPDRVAGFLASRNIDFIILAGFLWLVPQELLAAWPGRILNIHPALLPKYGGRGMYGMKVHEAVIASGDSESGITIHTIDEQYDRGRIIFQARCPVAPDDTPESLAGKVHELEHRWFPEVIEKFVLQGNSG